MNTAQLETVNLLVADGFRVIVAGKEIIRLTRGADRRVVMREGTQRRAHHRDFSV